ncbi:hypothetical protein BKE56_028605 [Rhodococcus sp. M8]|nr:hypothetical protein BKE56_028605 [Rhodococcus sp. M8]
MFVPALRRRDAREALGQVVRIIVAAPAPRRAAIPRATPGRAGAGPTAPMPIPEDLAAAARPRPRLGPGQVLATVSNIAQSSSASSRCRVRGRTRRSPVIASHEASPLLTRSRPRRT